ncbi:hypothetical protein PHLGIDRAFT_128279 [Phlebiopsis gigantea 11061_1 CR5-6]|uniref:ABM domain-containing protein n=1 Tax=Phlebiopsis gigantea (strain 11061_1 CR5-6) TaxID=745531 RepID=A0A0C3PJN5_PHLG1|nr:hypothetical protein PHLGIDRAFT_128279 [Phlebiopsis gigantea 11061_1 CR5-6]
MPLPTLEICKFVANEAYRTDPTAISSALDVLLNAPGCLALYHGLDLEDPQYFHVVVVWEDIQFHRALEQDEVAYPTLLAGIKAIAVSREYLLHANFAIDVNKALNAPLTELAWWTIPPVADKAVVVNLVQTLMTTIHRECEGEILAGGMGQCVEENNKLCVCLGWHSLERFKASIQGSPEAVEIIDRIKGIAELELKFAKLTKCVKN